MEVAKNSEFLHKFLPEELAKRYYAESLKRCAALKNAATRRNTNASTTSTRYNTMHKRVRKEQAGWDVL